jgi:hypothetical protein
MERERDVGAGEVVEPDEREADAGEEVGVGGGVIAGRGHGFFADLVWGKGRMV